MEIAIKVDCGNSPKKTLVKELTTLFASYQIDQAKPFFSDDIKWTLIGETTIIGKEKLANKLTAMSSLKTKKLTIHNIITHGKEAAVNGEITLEDDKIYGFCDIYQFTSAKASKITVITSYVIDIK